MKTKSSIHIAPGRNSYFAHNSRESFSHSQVFSAEGNTYVANAKTAEQIYKNELDKRSEVYTQRTRQKLQKKTVTHLSAIINLLDHHAIADLKPICRHLVKTLDTKILQVAIHKDEGRLTHSITGENMVSGIDFFMNPDNDRIYKDKEYTEIFDISNWEAKKNIHAHVEFLGIDSNGNAIKRNKLNKYYLMELQSLVAKSLGMERGKRTKSYTQEQMVEIKSMMKSSDEHVSKQRLW